MVFYINASTLLCSMLVQALPTNWQYMLWATLIGSSLVTMHLSDQQTVLDSGNCAHMLFEENSNEHGFDAYMDKIQELNGYLCRITHPLDLNALLLCYSSLIAFWLQPENRAFVTKNLFRIYLAQSGFAILRDDCHTFEKAPCALIKLFS